MQMSFRVTISLLCLLFVMAFATTAHAQLRATASDGPAPTRLYDTGHAAVSALGDLFGAEHFRMGHSYEMSFSAAGNQSASLGMYTNTMMWQFNPAWAARVDVGVAHSFSGSALGQQDSRVFLRNAEVAYRPSENMQFRLQIQQSPYGRYAQPYGYRGMGSRSAFVAPTPTGDLFWEN
mgnify:FL=1